MREIEKRLGLDRSASEGLKAKINQRFVPAGTLGRTVLVKVEGDGFKPDPDVRVDVKVKLIGPDSILSIKHGSWHGDAERAEYDVNFRRGDLANVVGGLSVFGYNKFILLSTLRTTWRDDNLIYTLDEYRNIGQSLFEIETTGGADEARIDQAFADLGITPMSSEETIAFIGSINEHRGAQIDLAAVSPVEVAARMLEAHAYVG